MIISVKNTDDELPIILRIMRREDGQEIDCLSEAQLLPGQSTEIDVSLDQSLTVFAR